MKKLMIGAAAAVAIAFAAAAHAQETTAPGYMIANYTITDQAGYDKHMEEAGPLAPRFGGKGVAARTGAPSQVAS